MRHTDDDQKIRTPTMNDIYTVRMPSSARRYQSAPVLDTGSQPTLRASRQVAIRINQPQPVYQSRQRNRVPLYVLLGAIAALLFLALGNAVAGWWNGWQTDIAYGYPRVSQLDAVVGHNDSPTNETHFIFLNLHGHVQIIEIPGGDASKARMFVGPTLIGSGQDMIPVTGEIRNEDGRLDLIVHIQDQQIVFLNDGSTFHEQ